MRDPSVLQKERRIWKNLVTTIGRLICRGLQATMSEAQGHTCQTLEGFLLAWALVIIGLHASLRGYSVRGNLD